MKNWIQGTEEMWACGTVNLPDNHDIITLKDGSQWTVRINGGYYLYDTGGNVHSEIQNASWFELASWFNKEFRPPKGETNET